MTRSEIPCSNERIVGGVGAGVLRIEVSLKVAKSKRTINGGSRSELFEGRHGVYEVLVCLIIGQLGRIILLQRTIKLGKKKTNK